MQMINTIAYLNSLNVKLHDSCNELQTPKVLNQYLKS